MEDTLNIILYVGVAIIYWWFKSSEYTWQNTESVEEEALPVETDTQPTPWEQLEQMYTVAKPTQATDALSRTQPSTPVPDASTPPRLPERRQPRVLDRYSGWKRSVIMGEVLRPIEH